MCNTDLWIMLGKQVSPATEYVNPTSLPLKPTQGYAEVHPINHKLVRKKTINELDNIMKNKIKMSFTAKRQLCVVL